MGAFTSPAVRRDAPACWFPLAHAEAIAAHPGLTLAGLTDSDPAAAQRAANAFGSPPIFSDLPALLVATRPELLCVATRTLGRAAIIEQAVASGIRMLHVEKPLCNSMQELSLLQSLLTHDDMHVTFGTIRRLMPPYQAAFAHVASGALGKLLEVQVNLGSGALCWTHPHSIDLLLFATGGRAVQDVSATLGPVETGSHPHEVRNDPEVVSVTIRFEDACVGRITRAPGADLILACEKGALAVEADGHRTRLLAGGEGSTYPAWAPWPDAAPPAEAGTLAALKQLVDCLDGSAEARSANATIKHDMLRGQHLLFAILQSNEQGGAPVLPEDVADDWCIWGQSHGKFA